MPTPMQWAAAAVALKAKGWDDWLPALRNYGQAGARLWVSVRGKKTEQARLLCYDWGVALHCRCERLQRYDTFDEAVSVAVRHARNVHRRQPWTTPE